MADLLIDAESPLSAFTLKAVHQIERLAPFGQHNARPLLCASGRHAGRPAQGHRRRRAAPVAAAFAARREPAGGGLRRRPNGPNRWPPLDRPIDIAFRPVINTYQGRHNVELHLVDWRMTESA